MTVTGHIEEAVEEREETTIIICIHLAQLLLRLLIIAIMEVEDVPSPAAVVCNLLLIERLEMVDILFVETVAIEIILLILV